MKVIHYNDPNAAEMASNLLKSGEVIAIPTDTVYGLAADASNYMAVKKIYELKKRHDSKPIAIFAKDLHKAMEIVSFSQLALAIIDKFPNEPFTFVLPKKDTFNHKLSTFLNPNDNFLGIRIVKHDFITKLFEKFDGFLAVTSANISGENSSDDIIKVKNYFPDNLCLAIQGEESKKRLPSMVIKIDNSNYKIIRGSDIEESLINFLINFKS